VSSIGSQKELGFCSRFLGAVHGGMLPFRKQPALEGKMATIFEAIVSGEIPCHKVWEDGQHLAFLDINPRVEGHTLVIPKKPWYEIFAMPADEYDALWTAARAVAHRLEERTGCERVVVVVLGYEVAHVHIHLMPTNRLEDFPFPPVDADAQARLDETARHLAWDEGPE
jgi:histidine triad (HIT) family protein